MSMPNWIVPAAEIGTIIFSAAAALYALFHDFKKDGQVTKAGRRSVWFIVIAVVLSFVLFYGKVVQERDRSRAAREIAAADARRMTSLTEEVLASRRLIDFARLQQLQFPVVGWTPSQADGVRVTVIIAFESDSDGDVWQLVGETHVPLDFRRRVAQRRDSAAAVIQSLDLRIIAPDDHDGSPPEFWDLASADASLEVRFWPTLTDPLGRPTDVAPNYIHPEGLPMPLVLDFGRGREIFLSFWRGGPESWRSRPRVN